MEGTMDQVTINGNKYTIRCSFAIEEKVKGREFPGIKIELIIKDENEMKLTWKDFKNTYLAEKICDYIRNTINGQRSFYWDGDNK